MTDPARNQSCQSPSPSLFCLNLISQWAEHGDLLWSELRHWRGGGPAGQPTVGEATAGGHWCCTCCPGGSSTSGHLKFGGSSPLCVQPCPTLYDPMDWSPRGSSIHRFFFRQEYWSGLPFLSPSLSLYQSYKLYPLALDQNSLHFEFLTRNPWKRSEE